MRKLVTVRTISKLIPINGADRIEVAEIDGWQCIVKKGEFAVGDKGLYFEIDSFLPGDDARYSFLGSTKQKSYDGKKGWRIRTMRMRGTISQGLLLPLEMFPELDLTADNLAEALRVVKYDVADVIQRPAGKQGKAVGKKFPSFIPKTDQTRIQNVMYYFNSLKDEEFEETLKLDGSSCTIFRTERPPTRWEKVKAFFGISSDLTHNGVCSRNLELKPYDNFIITFMNNGIKSQYSQADFWKVAEKYEVFKKLPVGFAIQGELIGPKIQGNHEKVDELKFYVFDIFDIGQCHYLLPGERASFMAEHLKGVPHTPVLQRDVKIFQQVKDIEAFQQRVNGKSMNKDVVSEGRVYKSCSQRGLSFKVINNEFLLRYES